MPPLGVGAEMLIDDFTQAPETRWRLVTDQVMGGVSTGHIHFGTDPNHVHLTGLVSTENNGGFIQVRRDLQPLGNEMCALTITVRGDNQTYYAAMRTTDATRPWHSYRAAFEVSADWAELFLPFEAFLPSHPGLAPFCPSRVRAIGFLAYGRDHRADLSIAKIAAK